MRAPSVVHPLKLGRPLRQWLDQS